MRLGWAKHGDPKHIAKEKLGLTEATPNAGYPGILRKWANTFPKFNSSPLKSYLPNRKVVFQQPSGAILNFGRVLDVHNIELNSNQEDDWGVKQAKFYCECPFHWWSNKEMLGPWGFSYQKRHHSWTLPIRLAELLLLMEEILHHLRCAKTL